MQRRGDMAHPPTGFVGSSPATCFHGIANCMAAALRPVPITAKGLAMTSFESTHAAHGMTKRPGTSTGDVAEEIIERDGITEGLVCVLSAAEPCASFAVVGNRE